MLSSKKTFLGLSMSIAYSGSGVQFFAFEHSQDYQQVERRFLQAVDSLDPDNIVVSISFTFT